MFGFGAAVRLKSGGPRMLVIDLDGDIRLCAWLGDDNRGKQDRFDWRTLEPA